MQIPNSLQDAWKKIEKDGNVTADEFKDLVKVAAPTGQDAEIDADELKFLTGLKSELEQNGITAKGSVPVGVLSFGAPPAEVKQVPAQQPEMKSEEVKQPEENTAPTVQSTPVSTETNKNQPVPFPMPAFDLPKVPVNNNWGGYSKDSNIAFARAFGEPTPTGNSVPYISPVKAQPIADLFGAGSVKQFQQMVGAKQDTKFGPETYFRTKATVATTINATEDFDKLSGLKNVLGVLGNDPEVNNMKAILDKRIDAVRQSNEFKQVMQQYIANVNEIVGKANPNQMASLQEAKGKLNTEFAKLPPALQQMNEVKSIHTDAMKQVDAAIEALRAKEAQIGQQKTELVKELNGIVSKAINDGLTSGDKKPVVDAKATVTQTVQKYPAIKDMEDVKQLEQKAIGILDNTTKVIDEINALIAKKDWTPADMEKAVKHHAELPDGAFKTKLGKAIEEHSEDGKLKEKNRSNLKTTVEGLQDVIGNGFWNLENDKGTRSIFQLVAKQGLLDEALVKMNVDDQTRAIKILTSDIKFDKMNDGDKFNMAIARSIYDNLSKSADVDGDVKKKVLPHLKEVEAPKNFGNFNIDVNNYAEGMKFSIGSNRVGSEKEAALTMARGIINGEVSKQVLGKLDGYELKDLAKFVEKTGAKEEKGQLLKTVSVAYNEGVSVNIGELDKTDKAKVIKGALDIENPNESRFGDMVDKAGKKAVFETVRTQGLDDRQLAILAKHTDGDAMADQPDVGAKLLTGMIKTYNKQEEKSPVSIGDIRKYIDQVDKDWWEDDDTMRVVISNLGDGPGSDYQKFQQLAPATLDKIWKISE